MDRNDYDELLRLTRQATGRLEILPEFPDHTEVFSFWSLPSFTNQHRTTLFAPNSKRPDLDAFVLRKVWNRDADREKLRSPLERLRHSQPLEPSFLESRVNLSSSALMEVIHDLSLVHLPSIHPSQRILALDGTGFRFRFANTFFGLDIHWWADQPPEWREATQRIIETVQRMERLLP